MYLLDFDNTIIKLTKYYIMKLKIENLKTFVLIMICYRKVIE